MTAISPPERQEAGALSAPRAITLAAGGGLAAGALAQLLSQAGGAVRALGAGTAIWVTIGLALAMLIARGWRGRDRTAWACAAAGVYLLAWLLAYHALYALLDQPPLVGVWREAQHFVATVAPACLVLGFIATRALREGRLGDVCLALPLGWSLAETLYAAQRGPGIALVVGVPTILVALLPLLLVRDRRKRASTLVLGAAASTAVVYLLFSPVLGILNR